MSDTAALHRIVRKLITALDLPRRNDAAVIEALSDQCKLEADKLGFGVPFSLEYPDFSEDYKGVRTLATLRYPDGSIQRQTIVASLSPEDHGVWRGRAVDHLENYLAIIDATGAASREKTHDSRLKQLKEQLAENQRLYSQHVSESPDLFPQIVLDDDGAESAQTILARMRHQAKSKELTQAQIVILRQIEEIIDTLPHQLAQLIDAELRNLPAPNLPAGNSTDEVAHELIPVMEKSAKDSSLPLCTYLASRTEENAIKVRAALIRFCIVDERPPLPPAASLSPPTSDVMPRSGRVLVKEAMELAGEKYRQTVVRAASKVAAFDKATDTVDGEWLIRWLPSRKKTVRAPDPDPIYRCPTCNDERSLPGPCTNRNCKDHKDPPMRQRV